MVYNAPRVIPRGKKESVNLLRSAKLDFDSKEKWRRKINKKKLEVELKCRRLFSRLIAF